MRLWKFAGVALVAGFALIDFGSVAMAQTGSYARTCANCSVSRGTIFCQCRRINGSWARASLNFTRCPRGSMTNLNGTLVCGP
jgi:hypothetical protein